jgi:Domain of unknown function (DUF397)
MTSDLPAAAERRRRPGVTPVEWRQASCQDGACVQVACPDGQCVEVARSGGGILLRDTDAPDVIVHIRPESWRAFLAAARGGEFDDLLAGVDER